MKESDQIVPKNNKQQDQNKEKEEINNMLKIISKDWNHGSAGAT